MNKYLIALLAGTILSAPVYPQDIPNHAMPVGGGPGAVGWKAVGPCAANQAAVWAGGAGADPSCVTLPTLTAVNNWLADQFFGGNRPFCDPNALANAAGQPIGVGGDDIPWINQCITNLNAAGGGGMVWLSSHQYCQKNNHFIDIPTGAGNKIAIWGEAITAVQIVNCDNSDVPVIKNENRALIANVFIQGLNRTNASFPAIWSTIDSTSTILINVAVNFGKGCVLFEGPDIAYYHLETGDCMGAYATNMRVPVFGFDGKFDQGSPQGTTITFGPSAWTGTHAYTAGNVVSILGGTVWIQAMTSGTSGSVEPVVTSWATNVTDSGVTWQLYSPNSLYTAIQFDPYSAGYGESKLYKTDASGVFTNAITVTANGNNDPTSDIMMSGLIASGINGVLLTGGGKRFILSNSEIAVPGYGVKTDTGWGGGLSVSANSFVGSAAEGVYLTGGGQASITGNHGTATFSDAFVRAAGGIGSFTAVGNAIAAGSAKCLKLDAGSPVQITFIGNACGGAGNAISATLDASTSIYGNDGSAVQVVNGGTGASTVVGARANLAIDQRSTFSNANYPMAATDYLIAQVGTMSAPRTVTLVAANTVNPGRKLIIADESGTVSSTNTVSVAPTGADTINNSNTTQVAFNAAFGYVELESDGVSKWTAVRVSLGSPLDIGGILPLANGGTNNNLTPTSGGVVWSDTTKLNVSAALTQNQLVIGGGAGAGPSPLGSLGTTTTLLHGNAAGAPTFGAVVSNDLNITATSCTNQFVTAISSSGVGTCTTDTLASAQHANQGTTTTVLHGNAAGNPSFGAVANADLANSTITIAGNSTALGGSITASTILDSIGSTRGSILERGASAWAAITPGTSAFPLISNGAGADPSYQALNLAGAGVTGTLGVGNGGTGNTGGAFTSYTPTVTCLSGGPSLSSATITGRYQQIGKKVDVYINVAVTTNGTCAGAWTVSLPVQTANTFPATAYGRENGSTGKLLYGRGGINNTSITNVTDYSSVYCCVDGSNVSLEMHYEAN